MNVIGRTLGMTEASHPVWRRGGLARLLLGTARYPSPRVMSDAVKASGAGIVTVSVRRVIAGAGPRAKRERASST